MKIVVIQEEIIQTDITPKELTERWKRPLSQYRTTSYLYRRCGRCIRTVDWSGQYE